MAGLVPAMTETIEPKYPRHFDGRRLFWYISRRIGAVCCGFRLDKSTSQQDGSLAGTRSRQQRRPGAESAQEEDAARGAVSRNEVARPLREAIREARPREGGSHPPRSQAGAEAAAARGSPAHAEGRDDARRRTRPRRSWRGLAPRADGAPLKFAAFSRFRLCCDARLETGGARRDSFERSSNPDG